MSIAYDPARTAFVLVDPYNDFFADDGKIYPRLREVAEAVGLRQHIRELLAAARAAGIQVVIAPHRRWHPGDAETPTSLLRVVTSWPASTGERAASRTPTLTSSSASTASSTSSWPVCPPPIYAEQVCTTADVIAVLKS